MGRGSLVALAILWLSLGTTGRAATLISLGIDAGSAVSQFQPGDPDDPESVRYASVSMSGPVTALNLDFSHPASKQLTVEFNAPVGQTFWAAIPGAASGWDNSVLVFQWYFSGVFTGAGLLVDSTPTVVFGNLTGAAPVLTSAVVEFSGPDAGPNGGGWLISAQFAPVLGSSFSFDSLSISSTIPDTYNAQFTTAAIPRVSAGLLDVQFEASDPGSWFGLAPVPEPSVFSLLTVGLAVLARRRVSARTGRSNKM